MSKSARVRSGYYTARTRTPSRHFELSHLDPRWAYHWSKSYPELEFSPHNVSPGWTTVPARRRIRPNRPGKSNVPVIRPWLDPVPAHLQVDWVRRRCMSDLDRNRLFTDKWNDVWDKASLERRVYYEPPPTDQRPHRYWPDVGPVDFDTSGSDAVRLSVLSQTHSKLGFWINDFDPEPIPDLRQPDAHDPRNWLFRVWKLSLMSGHTANHYRYQGVRAIPPLPETDLLLPDEIKQLILTHNVVDAAHELVYGPPSTRPDTSTGPPPPVPSFADLPPIDYGAYVTILVHLTDSLMDKLPTTQHCRSKRQILLRSVYVHCVSALIRLLAPVAPFVAEECWKGMYNVAAFPDGRQTYWKATLSTQTPASVMVHPFPTVPVKLANQLQARFEYFQAHPRPQLYRRGKTPPA